MSLAHSDPVGHKNFTKMSSVIHFLQASMYSYCIMYKETKYIKISSV